jgi:hypothetical protein
VIVRRFALLPLAALLLSARAEACSCVALHGTVVEQIEQSLNEADTVFVARLKRSSLKPDRRDRRSVAEDANWKSSRYSRDPSAWGRPFACTRC